MRIVALPSANSLDPKTGTLELTDPHFGKSSGVLDTAQPQRVHGQTSRLHDTYEPRKDRVFEMEKARARPDLLMEAREAPQDIGGNNPQRIQGPEIAAEAKRLAQEKMQELNTDAQMKKVGLVARERAAWLADAKTTVKDVLQQISPDYNIGAPGAGAGLNHFTLKREDSSKRTEVL